MAKRKADEAKAGDEAGFEGSLERLEEIVESMEAGDLPLEEAMALFEEGVKLGQACSQRLDEAERKITLLLEKADGSLAEQPFDAASAAAAEKPAPPKRAEPAARRAAPAPKPAPAPKTMFDDDDDRIPF